MIRGGESRGLGVRRLVGRRGVELGQPVVEHGREVLGVLDVGQVSAVGKQCQLPVGEKVDRGPGVVRGEDVVGFAPHDQGGRGDGGEPVEQDLALSGEVEQGAGHRGRGLELTGAPAALVLFGEEVDGYPPGLGEQHRRGHRCATQVAPGQAAEQDRQFADQRQGVHGEQGVHLTAEPGAVYQDQCADSGRVGEGQPHGDRAAGGVSDDVQRADAGGAAIGAGVAAGFPADRVSSWVCKAFEPHAGACHVTSSDLHPRSFPLLRRVIDRGFLHAVSFHGFDRSGILVGGAAPACLRREIVDAIAAAAAESGFVVRAAEPNESFGGDDAANVVNRLTRGGANGVQIEQCLRARGEHGQAIASAVAEVYTRVLARARQPVAGS